MTFRDLTNILKLFNFQYYSDSYYSSYSYSNSYYYDYPSSYVYYDEWGYEASKKNKP